MFMRLKVRTLSLVAALVVALSSGAFAAQKAQKAANNHVAVGTITSIDNNQVVISEKINGKEQPMTFRMDSSTKKIGKVATGSAVRIHYRTENNQNIATAVRQRGAKNVTSAKKPVKTEKTS
jgi:TRAP-type C4-dicarboxylate transport system substrate-binding protein